jgi:transposase-like protein
MKSNIIPPCLADEIASGDAVTLRDVARRFGVDPSVAFRWMQKGLPDGRGGRVRLACIRRGRWLTSESAVRRFFAALPQSEPTASEPPPIRTPAMRERDTERAKNELRDTYGV